jgi:hypothetical protein
MSFVSCQEDIVDRWNESAEIQMAGPVCGPTVNSAASLQQVTISTRLKANDLLDPHHGLHSYFRDWCKSRNVEMTKRQARKFLHAYPQYRAVAAAITLRFS